jgi:hypothetical protein
MNALLPMTIEKSVIEKGQYKTLPEHVMYMAKNYDKIHKVLIFPVKNPAYTGQVRTTILAPANLRTGVLLQNEGRLPAKDPLPNVDDLRPVVHYVFGSGHITYKCVLQSNKNVYVETVVTF